MLVSVRLVSRGLPSRSERRGQHAGDLARRLLQPRPQDGFLHRGRPEAEPGQPPRLPHPAEEDFQPASEQAGRNFDQR